MTIYSHINVSMVASFTIAIVMIWCATGRTRLAGKLNSGDARKINHITAFVGGACCFGWLEPDAARMSAILSGLILMTLVIITCLFNNKLPFSWAFAANTRESDAPHEKLYFWSSWLISMLALLGVELAVWNLEVTRLAAIIVGLGDGLAEPIGTRFGKHIYKVPSFWKSKPVRRSLEGSAVVLFGTFISVVLCRINYFDLLPLLLMAIIVATGVTVVEALSPHGLDNLTIVIASSVLLVSLQSY